MASRIILLRSVLLVLFLVQSGAFTGLKADERVPYISPGIKIGWDSNRGFTMGPKIGIGVENDGKFINVTLGFKTFQTDGDRGDQYVFLDVQIGSASVDEAKIPFGGGVGLIFGREKGELKISPRTTVFVGFILFPTLDFNFWNEEEISYEPGFELTLPIPLKKVDFGLE